MSIWSRFNQW